MTLTAVLVHGTFANGAPWTRSDSPVANEIRTSLGYPWNTEHFDWSGANSFQARETAAEDLGQRLDTLVSESKESRVVVIAHSHGGNVALRALRKMRHPDRVAAIVALGTPFLQIAQKQWAPVLLYAIWGGLFISTTTGIASKLLLDLSGLPALLLDVATFAASSAFLYSPLQRAKEESKAITLTNYRPDSGNVPLLLIRHSFDEAGLWLQALLLPRLLERILNIFGRIFIGNNWIFRLIWTFGFSILFVSIIQFIPFLDILFFVTIGLALAIPPLSATATLLSAHRFGLGGRLSLKHLFVQVTLAQSMHDQGAQIAKFSSLPAMIRARSSRSGRFATPHSLGYTDPKAISRLAAWLKAML